MHINKNCIRMLKESRETFISRDRLFLMQLYSYYRFQVKGHNKDIIFRLVVIWCYTAYSNITKVSGIAIKENSNIYTQILVYYVTK